MGKKSQKLNIPMCAALVLLMLTMISIHLTSGLYARYTTTASGSDSARVAKFDITGNGTLTESAVVNILPGQTVKKTLIIMSHCEVAVRYSLQVNVAHGLLPLDIIYPVSGELRPSSTDVLELEITWPIDQNSTEFAGKVDLLEISLDVVQID